AARREQRRGRVRRHRAVAAIAISIPITLLAAAAIWAEDDEGGPTANPGRPAYPATHAPGASRAAPARPRSGPSVLPGNVLIADKGNDRLLEVDPRGHVVWRFPRRGDLAPDPTLRLPHEPFFG